MSFASRQTGVQIAATFLAASNACGAVILVHGKDCCRGNELKVDSHEFARALTARRLSVLMIDLRGHGQSGAGRMSFGVHEGCDVAGAFDWLVNRGFDAKQIGLLGASMGGAAVVSAMGLEPRLVGPVVLDSAFAQFRRMIEEHFSSRHFAVRWLLPGCLWWSRRLLSCNLWSWSPAAVLARCAPRPLLVVHARGDAFVRVEHAHEIAQAARAQLWIAESDRHLGAFRDHPGEYIERVVGFLSLHLGHERKPHVVCGGQLRRAA